MEETFLSGGGRLTLIATMLNAMPMYFMSLFRIPKGIAEEMERKMRDFLWDEADGDSHCHLVAWDQVGRPKDRGGLGVWNIGITNKALLRKWWWRFAVEEELVRKRVIVSKYGLQENDWDVGLARNDIFRSPWKYILKFTRLFINWGGRSLKGVPGLDFGRIGGGGCRRFRNYSLLYFIYQLLIIYRFLILFR